MNIFIPDITLYVIAVLAMILVLIDLSRIEKKREREEKNCSDV